MISDTPQLFVAVVFSRRFIIISIWDVHLSLVGDCSKLPSPFEALRPFSSAASFEPLSDCVYVGFVYSLPELYYLDNKIKVPLRSAYGDML
jgi:hypothetical protein